MTISPDQLSKLRALVAAKGDVLEATMHDRLVSRGIPDDEARRAARACANQIWRNGALTGGATTVVLGTVYTPVIGAIAGGSAAGLAAIQTYLHAAACQPVHDFELWRAVEQVNSGY